MLSANIANIVEKQDISSLLVYFTDNINCGNIRLQTNLDIAIIPNIKHLPNTMYSISFISYIDSTELHIINIKIQYNNTSKHYQLIYNISMISIIRNMSLRYKNCGQLLSRAFHNSLTVVPT